MIKIQKAWEDDIQTRKWVYSHDYKKVKRSSPKSEKVKRIDDYAKWIDSQKWDFWCTFTTGYTLTLKSARRLMERYHDINRRCDIVTRLFWVAEPFELKDGYHTHALMSVKSELPKDIELEMLKHNFQYASGRKVIANISGKLEYDKWHHIFLAKYNKRKGSAGGYCSKYVMKEQSNSSHAEYDIII